LEREKGSNKKGLGGPRLKPLQLEGQTLGSCKLGTGRVRGKKKFEKKFPKETSYLRKKEKET